VFVDRRHVVIATTSTVGLSSSFADRSCRPGRAVLFSDTESSVLAIDAPLLQIFLHGPCFGSWPRGEVKEARAGRRLEPDVFEIVLLRSWILTTALQHRPLSHHLSHHRVQVAMSRGEWQIVGDCIRRPGDRACSLESTLASRSLLREGEKSPIPVCVNTSL
jgi:hypothetical protein